MPRTTEELVGYAIYLLVGGLALWKGGWRERSVSLIVLLSLPAFSLLQDRRHLQGFQAWALSIDLLMLAAFTAITMRTQRRWLLWATSFQLLATLTHLARALDPSIMGWAYITALVGWGYAVLVALLVGTLQHWLGGYQSLRRSA